MKKSALALAVLAALSLHAPPPHAQTNVQVYGLIDAGVEHVNHAGPNDGSHDPRRSRAARTPRAGASAAAKTWAAA